MFFGLFKRKPIPLIQDEAIQPVGEPISTSTAKSLFRSALTQLSSRMKLDRDDVSDYAEMFADEMREYPQMFSEDINSEKENVAEYERDLKAMREKLKSAMDGEERDSLLEDIEGLEEDIKESGNQIDEMKDELKSFKKDKRSFLRDELNRLIQQYNDGDL